MADETKKGEVNASDLEQRSKSFNDELIPLLAKYKLALAAQPLVNGTPVRSSEFLSARPLLVDDTKSPEAEKVEAESKVDEKKTSANLAEG